MKTKNNHIFQGVYMLKIISLLLAASLSLFIASCGTGNTAEQNNGTKRRQPLPRHHAGKHGDRRHSSTRSTRRAGVRLDVPRHAAARRGR
jgi:hypothetical protein